MVDSEVAFNRSAKTRTAGANLPTAGGGSHQLRDQFNSGLASSNDFTPSAKTRSGELGVDAFAPGATDQSNHVNRTLNFDNHGVWPSMSSYSASNPVIIHAGESMTHLLKELSIESLGDFKEFCRRFVALKVPQGVLYPLRSINYRTLLTEKVQHQVDWQLSSEGLNKPNVYEGSGDQDTTDWWKWSYVDLVQALSRKLGNTSYDANNSWSSASGLIMTPRSHM